MNGSYGVRAIVAERHRQIEEEHWSPDHDDTHVRGQLLMAAECYIQAAVTARPDVAVVPPVPSEWPWAPEDWKPTADPKRNLAKAGALIAAELDRVHRDEVRRSQHEAPLLVRADIADRWRKRDWPGGSSHEPPEWYIRLWAEYLETDEGRRRYPAGGFVGKAPVTPGAVGTDHAYCEHGTPTGYTCAACADETEGRAPREIPGSNHTHDFRMPPDRHCSYPGCYATRVSVGAAGSSNEPGRTGPGSQVHI